jgi:hypothetical protein
MNDRLLPQLTDFIGWHEVSQIIFFPGLSWNYGAPNLSLMTSLGSQYMVPYRALGWDRISWIPCPVWSQRLIPSIKASQVGKMIGMSHWSPTRSTVLNRYIWIIYKLIFQGSHFSISWIFRGFNLIFFFLEML